MQVGINHDKLCGDKSGGSQDGRIRRTVFGITRETDRGVEEVRSEIQETRRVLMDEMWSMMAGFLKERVKAKLVMVMMVLQ